MVVTLGNVARLYEYIGPSEFAEDARMGRGGTPLGVPADLGGALEAVAVEDGVVTFVVDRQGRLRIGPRRSEHVALAGGGPVQAAGELRLERRAGSWVATEVSNQSTGYCPTASCWEAVAVALDALRIAHPDGWTRTFQFQKCPNCGQINIIKDQWYVCGVCETDLPEE